MVVVLSKAFRIHEMRGFCPKGQATTKPFYYSAFWASVFVTFSLPASCILTVLSLPSNRLCLILLLYIRQMREGVLPLNIVIAVFYLTLACLSTFVLKLSARSLKKTQKRSALPERSDSTHSINYNKLIALSWLKKFTMVGALLNDDRKYLLKELLFISAYSATCLKINRIILWPVTFTLFLVPAVFLLYEVVSKKMQALKNQEEPKPATRRERINAIKNQGQSEMEIDSVNIDTIPAFSSQPLQTLQAKESAKQQRVDRCSTEHLINCALTVTIILMLFQTANVLTNSISNSGQLNITSVLIIICIDQFAIRIGMGLAFFGTVKIIEKAYGPQVMESLIVESLCQQQLHKVITQILDEIKRKQQEMTASPPRKKHDSPSRVPKALSSEHPTYLNLINLQPTRRKTQQQEEEQVAQGLQQIYLTTLEQQMFGDGEESKGGQSTKRKMNKENKEHSYLSAVQKFTIQQEEYCEDNEVKQDPLQECTINRVNPFSYDFSPINTKRRAVPIRKKHKRVLNLTGSSPYLEYLPDMLKNVDKFKQAKQNRML